MLDLRLARSDGNEGGGALGTEQENKYVRGDGEDTYETGEHGC